MAQQRFEFPSPVLNAARARYSGWTFTQRKYPPALASAIVGIGGFLKYLNLSAFGHDTNYLASSNIGSLRDVALLVKRISPGRTIFVKSRRRRDSNLRGLGAGPVGPRWFATPETLEIKDLRFSQ